MSVMRQTPDTAGLIALARDTLREDILPHLPPEQVYAARMAINALGIAGRQIAQGVGGREAATEALRPFCEAGALGAMTAELAANLRSGKSRSDDPALHAALLVLARTGTRESNPKARILATGQSARDPDAKPPTRS
jgi:hypothetical protein